MDQTYYSLSDVERLAGVSTSGLRLLRSQGKGPGGELIVGKHPRFPASEVHKWIADREGEPGVEYLTVDDVCSRLGITRPQFYALGRKHGQPEGKRWMRSRMRYPAPAIDKWLAQFSPQESA